MLTTFGLGTIHMPSREVCFSRLRCRKYSKSDHWAWVTILRALANNLNAMQGSSALKISKVCRCEPRQW